MSVFSSHPSILFEEGHLKIALSAYLFVKTQTSMLKMTYFYLLNMLKKKTQKVFIGFMQINIILYSRYTIFPDLAAKTFERLEFT